MSYIALMDVDPCFISSYENNKLPSFESINGSYNNVVLNAQRAGNIQLEVFEVPSPDYDSYTLKYEIEATLHEYEKNYSYQNVYDHDYNKHWNEEDSNECLLLESIPQAPQINSPDIIQSAPSIDKNLQLKKPLPDFIPPYEPKELQKGKRGRPSAEVSNKKSEAAKKYRSKTKLKLTADEEARNKLQEERNKLLNISMENKNEIMAICVTVKRLLREKDEIIAMLAKQIKDLKGK